MLYTVSHERAMDDKQYVWVWQQLNYMTAMNSEFYGILVFIWRCVSTGGFCIIIVRLWNFDVFLVSIVKCGGKALIYMFVLVKIMRAPVVILNKNLCLFSSHFSHKFSTQQNIWNKICH